MIGGLLLWLSLPVLMGLVSTWWTDPGSSYGFLIPPLALFVTWVRRDQLRSVPARPENVGLLLVAAACALFLAGEIGVGSFVCRWSILFFLAGMIWTFWGRRRLQILLFPLAILATMIPWTPVLDSGISLRLQILSSSISTMVARLAGIAIYREGNQLYLANIRLGVADACSGLHSISAMTVAALLLGGVYSPPWAARVLLLLSSVPVAVAANVFRITVTAIAADYRPELAMGLYHLLSGWLVFLVGFCGLAFLARLLNSLARDPQ